MHAVPVAGDDGKNIFHVRHWESRKNIFIVDGGIQPHGPKVHCL